MINTIFSLQSHGLHVDKTSALLGGGGQHTLPSYPHRDIFLSNFKKGGKEKVLNCIINGIKVSLYLYKLKKMRWGGDNIYLYIYKIPKYIYHRICINKIINFYPF